MSDAFRASSCSERPSRGGAAPEWGNTARSATLVAGSSDPPMAQPRKFRRSSPRLVPNFRRNVLRTRTHELRGKLSSYRHSSVPCPRRAIARSVAPAQTRKPGSRREAACHVRGCLTPCQSGPNAGMEPMLLGLARRSPSRGPGKGFLMNSDRTIFSQIGTYSPIVERPRLRLPGDARIALWIVPGASNMPPWPQPRRPDPWPRCPHPDILNYGIRDYGNRVGFWRLMGSRSLSVQATLSLNIACYASFPDIMEFCEARRYDVMCHGMHVLVHVRQD